MKKRIVILAGILMAGFLLTACGSSGGEQLSSNERASSSDAGEKSDTGEKSSSTDDRTKEDASSTETQKEGDASSDTQGESGGILSSFTATDLDGNEVDQSVLEDYELTVVNVWATFCNPCIREMPDLGELSEEYKDQGVQIIGLVSDVMDSDGSLNQDLVETARDIVEETGADYLHLLPSEDLYGLLYQISAVPTTFFVDSQGNQVGSVYVQSMSRTQWETVLDETLAEVES